MGPMHSDGLHYWYEEGVDWANNWVTESKQEFTDALSFICVKCQCRTTISVPKGRARHDTSRHLSGVQRGVTAHHLHRARAVSVYNMSAG